MIAPWFPDLAAAMFHCCEHTYYKDLKEPPKIDVLLAALECTLGFETGVLSQANSQAWKTMCGYPSRIWSPTSQGRNLRRLRSKSWSSSTP
jgi:hypothetical protein